MISQLQRPNRTEIRLSGWRDSALTACSAGVLIAESLLFLCLIATTQILSADVQNQPVQVEQLAQFGFFGTGVFAVVSLLIGRYRVDAKAGNVATARRLHAVCIAALCAIGALAVLKDDQPSLPFLVVGAPLFVAGCMLLSRLRHECVCGAAQEPGAALHQSASELSALSALVSHELRSPLTVLKTAMDLITDERCEDAEQRSLSEVMKRQVGRIELLLNELVDGYRAESDQIELRRCSCRLADICYSVVDDLQVELGDRRVLIQEQRGIPEAYIDPVLLGTAIRNLVGNAAKYTDASTMLWIRLETEGAAFLITVADAGPGIAPEALPHIFEPFFRGKGSGEKPRGFGLGLFLTRTIIERHGGNIAVTSEMGMGTTFMVRLPFATCLASVPTRVGELPR